MLFLPQSEVVTLVSVPLHVVLEQMQSILAK